MQMFDEFSVSYDIDSWGEYVEMISSKARLSCKRTVKLENAVDYIRHEMFTIYYRYSILEVLVELIKVELNDLRVAKKEMIKMKTTMIIDKNLSGAFETQDTYIKSFAFVRFDAGTALRTLESDDLFKRDE